MINRNERRQLDRDIKKSKAAINAHLNFLNAVGNPKYELRKISPLKAKLKRWFKLS